LSARDFGTGLPFTVVMFCAWTAKGAASAIDMASTETRVTTDSFFMGFLPFRTEGCSRGSLPWRRLAPAFVERVGSTFAGGAGIDGQGVDAAWNQGVQGIIYEAMPLQPGLADEAFADNSDAEVTALARTGVAGMQVAVILHFQRFGLQGFAQCGFDLAGFDRHGKGLG
jgi:hypothetical protein